MNRSVIAIATFVATLALGISSASAERYVKVINGREVVVHTNAAPVVLHRIVPPYIGKHVTERQVREGRMPPGARR